MFIFLAQTGQIALVMDLLGRGQVNETREKLQQMQHSFTYMAGTERRSIRDHSPGPLSTITEDNDSQGRFDCYLNQFSMVLLTTGTCIVNLFFVPQAICVTD